MGYRKKRGLDLEFPSEFVDDSGEKLEVCIASGTIQEFFTVRALWHRPNADPEAVAEDMEAIYDVLGPKLVSWNVDDEQGARIPFTRANLAAQDRDLVTAIVNGWLDAVGNVRRPLERPSPDGEPSPVASIPTETLPPAQAS